MHVAARLGLRVAIKYGLHNQGSLLIRDSERSTPLHSAARFGRLNICAQMLEVDEGKRAQFLVDQLGRLPVHLAAQYGQNRVLELFQSKGCIQRRCRQGNTTLHYAAMSGNPATCALILGINPSLLNETNHNGSTALHFAAMYKNAEVIEYLLTAGAKILPDHHGIYFTTLSLQSKNYIASKVIAMHKRYVRRIGW
ncbi:hypothetical protein AHF37_07396 [Paragonimus kellicotti]|nr:hypothetical protein AHF37_07396 [Paragonimus kellicotti]